VTVSVGVGQLQGDESPDTLLVRVATALARAKRAGYDRVELAMG
jgi:PleD family two-component response regulator